MIKKSLLIVLLSYIAHANSQSYFEAKSAIASGSDIQNFHHLKNHPLYPYLAADFYRKNPHRRNEVVTLFNRYFNAPPIRKLHNTWIKDQYDLGNYQAIAQNYYDTGDTTSNCIYRNAQLALGNRQAAFERIENIWFSQKSTASQCDMIFSQWPQSGKSSMLKKRALLAYNAKNTQLAERLASRMTGRDANTIQLFSRLLRNPEEMLQYPASMLSSTALHKQMLPKALAQLVRKDSSRYASFATQFARQLQTNKDYQLVLSKLVGYLANRQDPQIQSVYAAMKKPSTKATESLLRYLVSREDWHAIQRLIKPSNHSAMGLYWLGRAMEKRGKNPKAIYQKAAQTRSYYGFLAADKIGIPYHFEESPIIPSATTQSNFNKNNVLQRGKTLYQYGEPVLARKEILPFAKRLSRENQRQLAYWLSKNGFHHDAIYVLGKLRDWNDINVRFPTPFNRQVQAAHRLTGTDLTWIYAIIRQESSMNTRAVSRARAKGLMQLIPSTARLMAKDLGLSLYGGSIFDPETNTKLGANYLSKMHQRFGNIALASAAYNAGPGRVEQWLGNGLGDITVWIERIPFDETRKYVKHITEYQQVYAKHLNIQIPRITNILTQGFFNSAN